MEYVYDANFYLSAIYLGLSLLATITLGIAQRTYKPLKLWFYGSIFLSIGAFFGLIGLADSTYLFISYGFYIASILFLMASTLQEYNSMKQILASGNKIVPLMGKSMLFIPLFLFDSTASTFSLDSFMNPIIIVELLLLILVDASIVLCARIYKIKRTPTHFFIMLSLLFAGGSVFVSILDTLFSTIWSQMFSDAISIIFAVILFTTGLVSKIETSMIQNQKIIVMQNKMQDVVITNKGISEKLSVSAEELSSSAEEFSSSCSNIASSQQQISKGAANQVAAITETQRKFSRLSQGIGQIREKVQNINVISDLIQNIADQTNMLALNAAIEAARAGDAGRGFNVVAEQVRKLAEESRKSVSNTSKFLTEISKITNEQETSAFEILKEVDAIASVAEETSASTEESAAAAEQLASSMSQITSTSQELLFSAEKLKMQYETINREVQFDSEFRQSPYDSSFVVIEGKIPQFEKISPLNKNKDLSDPKNDEKISSEINTSILVDPSKRESF
jgi:methyl-accepting chemotaxis protein